MNYKTLKNPLLYITYYKIIICNKLYISLSPNSYKIFVSIP